VGQFRDVLNDPKEEEGSKYSTDEEDGLVAIDAV